MRNIFSKKTMDMARLSTVKHRIGWKPEHGKRYRIRLKDVLSGEDYIPDELK
jgi:hypothetical protein